MANLGYQKQTTGAAAALQTIPDGANFALLQAETTDVRWTDDGSTTPTAAIGFVLKAGDPPFAYRGNLALVKVFAASAGVLHIGYYAFGRGEL